MTTIGHARQLARFREREERILAVARRILVHQGFDALSMDTVAEAVHWSKGTIYQHFKSKEDVLLALMLESMERKSEFFQRAALFRGRARERMQAIGMANALFEKLYPEHPASFALIHANASRARISAESCRDFLTRDATCHTVATGIVRDAIAAGDLALPPDFKPEDVTFALWSSTLGARYLLSAKLPIVPYEVPDPDRVQNRNARLVMDGLGWKPLSSEWDYESTQRRILAEVFPDESRLAAPR
ncbi:MAG: TetR/AcrR family transcriptional regulator [Planctomycetota bacterium]